MAEAQQSHEELQSVLAELKQENVQLKATNAELLRLIRGSSSERFIKSGPPSLQGTIFETPEDVPSDPKTSKPKQKPKKLGNKRTKIPAKFPRRERVLEPLVDTSEMTKMGEVVSEQYGIEISLHVDRLVRPKYIDAEEQIHIASYDNPFPKSNLGVSLASHVAVSKYVDHLPLYRQSKMFKREGADLSRSTLYDGIARIARLLQPLYDFTNHEILQSDYLMADESSIPVLSQDKPGAAQKGQMLVKVDPLRGLVVFDYIKTKEKINILGALKGIKCYLQTDGNVSYEAKDLEEGVTHLNCLIHSRRKFEAALEEDHKRSSYVLECIQKIYLHERAMREHKLSVDDIRQRRQQVVKPIMEELKTWLDRQYRPDLRSNLFNRAVRYMLKRWSKLIVFLDDGRLHPDTNLLERQIRPMAIGRRNYLFAGSHNGAHMAALFYSFFAMCSHHQLDPRKWLSDVIHRISEHKINALNDLLPTSDYQFLVQD